ncbi:Programmed cell death protein 2-like [Liparis tanakae]|uniref:Programmed cell death protein 2-like n=1 Tax=Liparis tanakae TaxID=230148 RepID=A0A4Z2GXZ9_9TELE|nr:Programmed cell death protein 2-like [Liparis tanakae]
MAAPAAQEPTLVGLCDAEMDVQRHESWFRTNKVGGLPDWPPGVFRKPPLCGRCGAPLAQVVQVYCPLEASPYHRNLHLFACTRAACSGRLDCWKVLRSQSLEEREEERPPPAQEAPRSATEWCDTADDWGMEEEGEEEKGGGGGGGGVEKEAAAAPQTEKLLFDRGGAAPGSGQEGHGLRQTPPPLPVGDVELDRDRLGGLPAVRRNLHQEAGLEHRDTAGLTSCPLGFTSCWFLLTELLFSGTTLPSISHTGLPSETNNKQTNNKRLIRKTIEHYHVLSSLVYMDAGSIWCWYYVRSKRSEEVKLLTGGLLREHHPGLGGDVGAADEQLVSPGNGAAGRTEALHQREILTGALGCGSRRVRHSTGVDVVCSHSARPSG